MTPSQGLAYAEHPHAIAAAERLEYFAEMLSENLTVTEAAQRTGISRNRANKYLRRIRERLGPQAV